MQSIAREELVAYQSPILRMRTWEISRIPGEARTNAAAPPYNWHYHQEAELVLMLQGEMDFYIEQQEKLRVAAGDIVIVGPSQLHTGRTLDDGAARQIVCQFDMRLYLDAFAAPYSLFFHDSRSPLSRLNRLFRQNRELNDMIAKAVLAIYEETQQRKIGYELAVSMHVKHIMLGLLRCDEQWSSAEGHGAWQLLKPILLLVEHRYMEKLDLREASRMVNLSYHYVSRLFSKTMGISFTEYVNRKRIQAAERLLVTSDKNIIDISAEAGITNAAHFFEIFKRYNRCSPSEFRKRFKNRSPAENATPYEPD